MSLEAEIKKARKEIVSDGYDMSLGEVINLYKDGELKINPEFQRLFRWDITRKTRFIESILLGIPIPPIFVYQDELGVWQLIDGLQRLSTVFEFCGILRKHDGTQLEPSTLEGTKLLPSLANRRWQVWAEGDQAIDRTMQLQIKRARIRVEILQKESDENAKYELFQRLNTGGAKLSEQEVRNCVAVMVNLDFYKFLVKISDFEPFKKVTNLTQVALEKQAGLELALRFLSFRSHPYKKGLDVHEYLDDALINLASSTTLNLDQEESVFNKTFSLLNEALGENSFKKWNGNDFSGMFLMSVYEVVAYGLSVNLDEYDKIPRPQQIDIVIQKSKELWSTQDFINNSGAGVRGTTRLANLLPLANGYMKP